jgi:hypothetical protein
MLEWPLGDNEQNDQDAQAYFAALNALRQYIDQTIASAEDIAKNLNQSYSEEGLTSISKRFEAISKSYTDFTILASHAYNPVIRKSMFRLSSAKKVAIEARNIALLFEKCARNPRSFSAVNGRLGINKLIGELKNLATYCSVNSQGLP